VNPHISLIFVTSALRCVQVTPKIH